MKAVIQRVAWAKVSVRDEPVSRIDQGILTLLGIMKGDSEARLLKLIRKIVELRIFEDEDGKMNRSLTDIGGSHLIVPQFTLGADTSSGKRPSFDDAERPELARPLYEKALRISAEELGVPTSGGVFQADMQVSLLNDGPVTLILQA